MRLSEGVPHALLTQGMNACSGHNCTDATRRLLWPAAGAKTPDFALLALGLCCAA